MPAEIDEQVNVSKYCGDVFAALRATLPRSCVPDEIVLIKQLPLTHHGNRTVACWRECHTHHQNFSYRELILFQNEGGLTLNRASLNGQKFSFVGPVL